MSRCGSWIVLSRCCLDMKKPHRSRQSTDRAAADDVHTKNSPKRRSEFRKGFELQEQSAVRASPVISCARLRELAAGASVAARVDRSSFARRPQLLDRVNVAWLRNAATQRIVMVSKS